MNNTGKKEYYLGAHVSAGGGVANAPLNAGKVGANAFALFSKNQRQWQAPPLEAKQIESFKQNMVDGGFKVESVLPHDSYLINLANPDAEKREKSYQSFVDEAKRAVSLGLCYLNFHPGATIKAISERQAVELVAEAINRACNEVAGITFVIENTAGQGSNIGWQFEHLAWIIKDVADKSRVGVCVDTCHAFAAGYDLRNKAAFDRSFTLFDQLVGFDFLKAMHLNDAKSAFESRVDRHASIGEGHIGLEPFKLIMRDDRFRGIPLILETPNPDLWKQEIELLRSFIE